MFPHWYSSLKAEKVNSVNCEERSEHEGKFEDVPFDNYSCSLKGGMVLRWCPRRHVQIRISTQENTWPIRMKLLVVTRKVLWLSTYAHICTCIYHALLFEPRWLGNVTDNNKYRRNIGTLFNDAARWPLIAELRPARGWCFNTLTSGGTPPPPTWSIVEQDYSSLNTLRPGFDSGSVALWQRP